jgi:Flp pilus assembly secretin CpaC
MNSSLHRQVAFALAMPILFVWSLSSEMAWAQGAEDAATLAPGAPSATTVYLGQAATFSVDANISEAIVADERVCSAKALAVEGEPSRQVLLTGRAYGATTVCVFFKDPLKAPAIVRVAVETDAQRFASLEAAVAVEFPSAGVRLVAVPTSEKVIIKSNPVTAGEAAAIFGMVESASLKRAQIIDRMPRRCPQAAPCCPKPCCRQSQRR